MNTNKTTRFTVQLRIIISFYFLVSFQLATAQTCADGQMNGDETGVDCGGSDCSPCLCTESKLLLQQNSYSGEFHRNTKDWTRLRNDVTLDPGSHTAFSSMNFIELNPTFEVKQGAEALFTIDNCIGQSQENLFNIESLSDDQDCGTLFPESFNLGSPCNNSDFQPVTIRVYLHVIHEDDGTGGITPGEVEVVKQEMNETYNKHGIFFDFCVRNINFSAALIDALQIPDLLYPFVSLDDGINGYLIPRTTPSGGFNGVADGIPSSNFWSKNTFGTPSHEIGHCLNLFHTHMNYYRVGSRNCIDDECRKERVARPEDCSVTCPEFDCETEPCVPNCYEVGDMVCDTPPDLFLCRQSGVFTLSDELILNYPDWTDACGEEYIANDIIPTNVMSLWRRDIQITKEQACRVHQHITTDGSFAILSTPQDCPVIPASCSAIEFGTSVWTTNREFNRNVVINGDLTIDGALITFARGTSLTVNGDLTVINNSVLGLSPTSPCNETNNLFWIGVRIHHLATVTIGDSFIESSQLGISVTQDPILTDNFPFIVIDNTTFLNNFSSVRKSNSSGVLRITDSAFILSNSYTFDRFGSQLLVASARGTNFISRASFQQNMPNFNGTALETYNSQVTIVESNFEGWIDGIRASNMILDGLRSTNNSYTDNLFSITMESGVLRLNHNEFNLFAQRANASQMIGVQIENVSDFIIEDNEFSSPLQRNAVGMIITDSGSQSLEVTNNEFTDMRVNVETIGDNGDSVRGIQFTCNKSNGLNDSPRGSGEYVVNGSILSSQGLPSSATGNVFAHDCFSTSTDFDYNGSQLVFYYHDESDQLQIPQCTDGIFSVETFSVNTNCVNSQRTSNLSDEDMYRDIEALNTQIEKTTKNLNNLLDGGLTDHLKEVLRGQSDLSNRFDQLTKYQTLISAKLIKELLQSEGNKPSSELLNLIKENPTVLGDPFISNIVSDYLDFNTLGNPNESRLQLENELVKLNQDKFDLIRYATMRLFDNKKIGAEIDLIQYRRLLEMRNDFFGCIQVIESYMYDSDFDSAKIYAEELTLYNALIDNYNDEDLADYIGVLSIAENAAKDGRDQNALNKDELDELFRLSTKKTKFASAKAKGILSYYYNDVYISSLNYQ